MNLTDAERHYFELALAQPQAAEPWFQLGNHLASRNRLSAAEYAYREALKREKTPRTLHNLGLVQVRLGVSALSEAHRGLRANDPIRKETREFLRVLLKEGL